MHHLDPEKQRSLAMRAQRGDQAAKERLVETNQSLVAHWAKRFAGRGVEFEELMQEGQTGMLRAIDKYRLDKNANFATYASLWIRQAMGRACEKQGSTNRFGVKLPSDVCNAFPHIDDPTRKDFAIEQARRMQQQGPPSELEEARGVEADREINLPLIRSVMSQGCGHIEQGFHPDLLCLHGFRLAERAWCGELSESEWFMVSRMPPEGWKLEITIEDETWALPQAARLLSARGLERLLSVCDDLPLIPQDSCASCAS